MRHTGRMAIRTNRSHTQDELEEKYQDVWRRHLSGEGVMAIARALELSYPTVRKIIDACKANNGEVPLPQTRGRKSGQGRSLSTAQQAGLLKALCNEPPDSARPGLRSTLWDTSAVQRLVQIDCAQDLPYSTTVNYLERWGIIPEHPFEVGLGKNKPTYIRWASEIYPLIEMEAKAAEGEVLWLFEDGVYGEACTLLSKHPSEALSEGPPELILLSAIQGKLCNLDGEHMLLLPPFLNVSWLELPMPKTLDFSQSWMLFKDTKPQERVDAFLDALKRRAMQSKKTIFLIACAEISCALESSTASASLSDEYIKIHPLPT